MTRLPVCQRLHAGALVLLFALPLLAACASSSTPAQRQRADDGHALFEERCKNVAGIKIYKTVADVEGVVLLKLRPKAGDREWADPMWPGAAFAIEEKGDGYINTFLGFEQAFGNDGGWTPITTNSRGYINTNFSRQNPFNLPGYRYVDVVDVVDAATGKRERYSGYYDRPWERDPERYSSKNPYSFWKLKREPAPAEGPQYGVTFEDHVIPEERALGLASSTVKVLDLKTDEVLGEMTMYAWTSAKANPANPSPWLTAYRCGNNFKMGSVNTRLFVDQILQPRKDR